MKKCICKANIRANKKVIFLPVSLMLIVAIIGLVPVRRLGSYFCNIFYAHIYSTYWDVEGETLKKKWMIEDGFFIFIIPFIVFALVSILCWLYIKSAKSCSIELNDKCVKGVRKTIFSKRDLNLPIEQIDSIMVSHSLWDALFGGEKLLIRSASGMIKFPWVRNAKEFSDAVLAKIDEYKQNDKEKNKNSAASALNNSGNNAGMQTAAQKIKDLNELLEIGAISQEEFNAKRKELLDKM